MQDSQCTPTIPANYYSSGLYFQDFQKSLSDGDSSSTPSISQSSLNFSDTNRPQSGTSNSSSLLSRLNPFNYFSRNSADYKKNNSNDDYKDNYKNDSIIGFSSGNLISAQYSDGILLFSLLRLTIFPITLLMVTFTFMKILLAVMIRSLLMFIIAIQMMMTLIFPMKFFSSIPSATMPSTATPTSCSTSTSAGSSEFPK